MTHRWRTLRYGAGVGLAVVGVVCGATIPGTLGGTLATVLIGIGLVAVVSLVFYEIGLSEDRERATSTSPAPNPSASDHATPRPGPARRQPDRLRGQRRRLR